MQTFFATLPFSAGIGGPDHFHLGTDNQFKITVKSVEMLDILNLFFATQRSQKIPLCSLVAFRNSIHEEEVQYKCCLS